MNSYSCHPEQGEKTSHGSFARIPQSFRSFGITLLLLITTTTAHATTIKEVKTTSGITAWLVEEHSQPLISMQIAFKNSGTAYDPENQEGRAALTTSMLLEGAGDMDSEAFNRALENTAIRLSFAADDDNFYSSIQTLSENKEKAFKYLGLALTKPRFDAESLTRLKSQTLLTIKQQQEKYGYRLNRAWQKQIFENHPYNKEELGNKESLELISADELRSFTENYLTRDNIIISVVGDITESELAKLIDDHLAALPKEYKSDTKIQDIKIQKNALKTVLHQDIPQTIIQFGFEGLKRNDPEFIPAFVMNYILGGGSLTSRLNKKIREEYALTYSASSSLTPMNHAAVFSGRLATRNEKAEEAISALKDTLKHFAENGTNEQELADAKKFLTGSFVVSLDSNANIVNFITMMQLQNLGIDYINKRNNLINEVSVNQVAEIAKKLIKLDKLQIVMIGKPQLNGDKKP